MLEIERLHSHLLWVGLACHILGFDTLFMQSFRIREPVMWIAEKITGNRKTYGLCLIGGVRWDITPELRSELRAVLDRWSGNGGAVVDACRARPEYPEAHARGRGRSPTPRLVKDAGLVGPVARAAGVDIDCRRDHPYAAYDRVEFKVITRGGLRRLVAGPGPGPGGVRIHHDHPPVPGEDARGAPPIGRPEDELPVGRIGLSSVEAPRGESHHFVVTGENNRPRRWRVRAPTYQNLQGVPAMIKDQQLADMTISLGSIDPCFSCTDRLETWTCARAATASTHRRSFWS